jgi:hypothetical protein
MPRTSRYAITLKTINSRLEFGLLLRGQRHIAIIKAIPELADEIELLVGGQLGQIECRAGHAPNMPPPDQRRQVGERNGNQANTALHELELGAAGAIHGNS